MSAQLTIGGVAKLAGVNLETVRFYQRRGLVAEPPKPLGGIRRYAQQHVQRIRFIKQAQTLGFSLEEVAELLALDDGQHCHEAERLGTRKLADVRERVAQMQRIEQALAALVDRCHCNTGNVRCPLIASLEANTPRPT
jgi:MerR family mercuric resistance operon transcriptional regulator